ncbi:protein-L-isoaspartate O-methyltransferase [Reyranella sp. CPCC 100927]|uniref:protein-L-isoaspartate O-methyltransferase family protein n=1 Tax=Reyranella sp. CPCC 100927 TaxID=2599616 RepID=UPI001C49947F|nr:protein-L-isoaspartate O-methyltransferase [Reyranella sp. CPCC 100927]
MRRAIKGGVAALFVALLAMPAMAQFKPIKPEQSPPMDSKESYIAWMKANRGESDKWLNARWDRFVHVVRNKDLWTDKTKRAFLLTPREVFAAGNPAVSQRGYEHAFLDMGFGVTMSGPHLQSRMTEVIDVKRGEKVLEIGTGSGTQAGYLSELTDKVYTIEIIAPLATRTRGIYDKAIAAGYEEFKGINTKQADGYYGWQEAAPFDKIIVTTGIDHIPPPLLQQLKPGGIMVIPVGPPGAQRVLKVIKQVAADGAVSVTREDIYGGKIVPFVPFTKLVDGEIKGTHNK